MTSLDQIPDMQLVAIAATQQNLWIHAILHHVRRSPFAGDHRVVSQMPPEIVSKFLRATIQFPLSEKVEDLVIYQEKSTGTITVRRAQRAEQNSIGAAMNRVRRCISCTRSQRLWFDDFHDFRLARIGLG